MKASIYSAPPSQTVSLSQPKTWSTSSWPDRSTSLLRVLLATAVALVILLSVAATRADVDLWGHVRFGMDMLKSGQIDAVDPYSFTSDRPWVNHEWLAEVIFAVAWRVAGNAGLIAVKLACIAGTLLLLAAVLRERNVIGGSRLMLLGLALAGILPRVNHVRPQLFSVLLFAALLVVFTRAERGSRKTLVLLMPILAVWTNVHGGWIVGLATVGVWALGDAWAHRTDSRRAMTSLACASAATLATLLNPYGVGLWRFLLETVRLGRDSITEWNPVWTEAPLLLLWTLFAVLALTAILRGRGSVHPAHALIPALWGLAALRVGRLDAFFALSMVGLLGHQVQWLFGTRDRPPASVLPARLRYTIGATIALLVLSTPVGRRPLTCVQVHPPWWPEPQAVEFAAAWQLSGRVVTFFRWGEYAIWHLPATLKVSMDGRRETVYTDRTLDGHLELYRGTDAGLAYLETLETDFIWLPGALPVTKTLQDAGWIPVFQGPQSVWLASRAVADRFDSGIVAAAMPAEVRCFPGP